MKIFKKEHKEIELSKYRTYQTVSDKTISIMVLNSCEEKIFYVGGTISGDTINIHECKNYSDSYNRGYIYGLGTVSMKWFLNQCVKKNLHNITGEIIPDDWQETGIRKLKRFYVKFGFELDLNKRAKTGKIQKQII